MKFIKYRAAIAAALCIFISLNGLSFSAAEETEKPMRFYDVDGSGTVDSADALLVLQFSVGKISLDDDVKSAADVNGNGVTGAEDALLILQYSVGKINPYSPKIVETVFPTDDVVIADYDAADFGADPTGTTDSTAAIQSALSKCRETGGGTVWLGAGKYIVSNAITIPSFVSLRGDWCVPDGTNDGDGTVIIADLYPYKSDALFFVGGSAGVIGLTVYYPHQNLEDVQKYPYTFYISGAGDGYMLQTVKNCTVINGYRGIGATVYDGIHEMLTIDGLYGTFLCCAAELYNSADVGTVKNVYADASYWANSSFNDGSVTAEQIRDYTMKNATGMILGDLEWTEFYSVALNGFSTGINIVDGRRIQFAGSFYGLNISDCKTAIRADNMDSRWGSVIANASLSGSDYAVNNLSGGLIKLTGVQLEGAVSGSVQTMEPSFTGVTVPDDAKPQKPSAVLYVLDVPDRSAQTDITKPLQNLLDKAEKTGGIVYIPAGLYSLHGNVSVPAGVELRGCSSVATRDQGWLSLGTLILVYTGKGLGQNKPAVITLSGENSGVRGMRFIVPDNITAMSTPTGNPLKYPYIISSRSEGVYCVNSFICGAWYGVDFSGCDNHYINRVVGFCFGNMIKASGKNGYIEGVLQNENAVSRMSLPEGILTIPIEGSENFWRTFEITRAQCSCIILDDGSVNQTVLNCFAYGAARLVQFKSPSGALLVNIGADNVGKTLLSGFGGDLTAINILRWNGTSFSCTGTYLRLYNRITIGDKSEPNIG